MVSVVLHNNVPVKLLAVSTELPQLLTVDIEGAVGYNNGTATPEPFGLTQPFTVCFTVRVLLPVTVMDTVVALVLHKSDPVKSLAVNTELPQLFCTVAVGAGGMALGAAVLLPARLVQEFTVCVTE